MDDGSYEDGKGGLSRRRFLELAGDAFRRIVASAPAGISAESDWTCRAQVGGLEGDPWLSA